EARVPHARDGVPRAQSGHRGTPRLGLPRRAAGPATAAGARADRVRPGPGDAHAVGQTTGCAGIMVPMSSPSEALADAPLDRPRNLTDLFVSFTLLALQGFGGVLAVVQRELVENKRWMTKEEFIEEWAVAQIMPGPNVINLGITLGWRYF